MQAKTLKAQGLDGLEASAWKHPLRTGFAVLMLGAVFSLASCGGGGSSAPAASTTLPTVSIANASVLEGNTLGATNLNFTVTLSSASTSNVMVSYATSDGTALSTSDYTAGSASLTIAAGNTTGTITVILSADTTKELNETLTLTLSSPSNATLGTSSATGTILNDDVWGLNDTGITKWGNATVNNLISTQAAFPLQDADKGRDVSFPSNSDGNAGFVFIKLDSAGGALANQASVYTTTPWDCVQDSTTGLIWEVKTTAGLRSKSHTYSWYNSTAVNDGGNAGTANGGTCFDTTNCDTEKYVAAVNALTGTNRLCGQTDWRLPKKQELLSIVDYSTSNPSIDTGYFPNTIGSIITGNYRSSTPSSATEAWDIGFGSGNATLILKSANGNSGGGNVRLVRGGL